MQKTNEQDKKLYRHIWGCAYFAAAAYLLIALVNNIVYPQSPLFGPILGANLALGMKALFGTYPQFLFVAFLLYTGIRWFKNYDFLARQLIAFFMILALICTAFAIPQLPIINIHPSIPGGNLLGNLIAKYAIYPVFGRGIFGAYFMLLTAVAITIVYMFKIDVVAFAKIIWAFLKAQWTKIKPVIDRIITKIKSIKLPEAKAKEDAGYNFPEPQIIQEEMQFGNNFSPPQYPPYSQGNQEQSSQNPSHYTLENIVISGTNAGISQEAQGSNSAVFLPENQMGIQDGNLPPVAYFRPNPNVLPNFTVAGRGDNRRRNEEISNLLIAILEEFGIRNCEVVAVNPGPIVTLFEIKPGAGVKIAAFEGLEKDIGVKIGGKSVRIDTIPDKTTIGIEVPNENREMVYFKEILMSPTFQNSNMKLPVIIGKGTTGQPLVEDIAKMPHILIAGQTGSGKSVGINSFIASLLFGKHPDDLRFIMIDPKKVEMACYEGIPHLLMPVVTEVENAVKVLECAVKEMMYRYDLLKKVGSKNMDSFNEKFANGELDKYVQNGVLTAAENKKMCYIVVVIDELADLMMTAGKDVEKYIQRIAQLARAVGIHLIVATQRPDTKVITGNIKANLPSRIAFRVMSYIDSRTILDSKGAEQLLGNGDMLYLKNGAPKIVRFHGAFISEKDVENLVEDIKKQNYRSESLPSFDMQEEPDYGDNDLNYKGDSYFNGIDKSSQYAHGGNKRKFGNRDENFEEAARMVVISKLGSTSSIQRHLNLGYARAGRVMDELAAAGIVGPQEVMGKPRKVLVNESELEEVFDRLLEEG